MADQRSNESDSLAWMHSQKFQIWHQLAYAVSHWTFTLGFSLRTEGYRNLPKAGPVLIVANHQSFLDPLLIGLCARRPLVYLARKTLFKNRFLAAAIRSLNAVPIDQEGVGKEGLRTILDQLNLGRAVVVFPEGERTPNGQMLPLKPGIHLLIKRAQVPIVPVGIAGAYEAWPRWQKLPIPAPIFMPAMPGTISASLGKPIDATRFADLSRDQALSELFSEIHAEQKHAERLRRR